MKQYCEMCGSKLPEKYTERVYDQGVVLVKECENCGAFNGITESHDSLIVNRPVWGDLIVDLSTFVESERNKLFSLLKEKWQELDEMATQQSLSNTRSFDMDSTSRIYLDCPKITLQAFTELLQSELSTVDVSTILYFKEI